MPLNDGLKEHGLCNIAKHPEVNPEIWWPNGTTGAEAEKIVEAKSVCDQCPVKLECLFYAVDNKQFFGIWGGTTEEERREQRRVHRRILAERVDSDAAARVA